jgi:hypothetical protein
MPTYCVNKDAQSTGEHEVHEMTCSYLPDLANRRDLGYHLDCHGAVSEAERHYNNVDGCAYCCPSCHTR